MAAGRPGDGRTAGGRVVLPRLRRPHHEAGALRRRGSLEQLSPLAVERTIYIHINNTNPILLEDAPERRLVEQHGMEVAVDGLDLQV